MRSAKAQVFNNRLDACVTSFFLALVAGIFLLSLREWILLLARKKLAVLRETEPTWLPDYAIVEGKPSNIFSYFALFFALAKELSGQADIERATATQCACALHPEKPSEGQLYVATTEARYKSVRRCC